MTPCNASSCSLLQYADLASRILRLDHDLGRITPNHGWPVLNHSYGEPALNYVIAHIDNSDLQCRSAHEHL